MLLIQSHLPYHKLTQDMNKLLLTLLMTASLAHANTRISGAPQEIIHNIENRLVSKNISIDGTANYSIVQLKSEISEAIYPFGYFNPEIDIILSPDKQILIDIELGELTRIGTISLTSTQMKQNAHKLAPTFKK